MVKVELFGRTRQNEKSQIRRNGSITVVAEVGLEPTTSGL